MRRVRYFLLLVLLAGFFVALGFALAGILFRQPLPALPAWTRGAGAFFFGFLCVLILRHFILMWFAYLDGIEGGAEPECQALPPVSILVPAFNESVTIQASIRSLLELDYPSFEILVIDDGSTDDTFLRASAMEGRYSGTRVRVLHKANGGKASALNLGISAAHEDLILCVDGDSRIEPGSLRAAVRHFGDPKVGAVAGNVKVANRRNLLTRLQALEYVEGLNMSRRAQAFFRSVAIIPGPFGMFRRRVLREAGGYSEDTYAEDADLTLKILERGWRVRYEPNAIAFTEAPEGMRDLFQQRYRWSRGLLQAVKKRVRPAIRCDNALLSLSILHLLFEGLLWPLVNLMAQVWLLYMASAYQSGGLLLLWWLQLTVLDLVAGLFCVVAEEEDLRLVPYAIPYRLFFTLCLDVCRVGALVEETLSVEMGWGKLERRGRI
ncbi:MAG: glycosyltransferase [Candidatus Eisenbacteria bacterium]